MTEVHLCRVPPFGYPRIYARLQLPVAFRRWPRPSSPPGTKASTIRPLYLDLTISSRENFPLKTPENQSVGFSFESLVNCSYFFFVILVQFSKNLSPIGGVTLGYPSLTLLNINGGDDRNRTRDPLRAKQVLSQLSYIPMKWWA